MSTGLRLASSMFATILALTACAGTSQDSPADGPPESPTTTSTADQSSPSSTPPTATTSSAAGSEQAADGSCTITVTGDREGEWTFPQSIYSITSDHWLSEEELRDTVDQLGTDIAGGTYEEITSRGDPVVTFLALGCQDANNLVHGVFVTHTNGTKTTDLPMESGDYEITGGLFDAEGPTGTIIAGFDVSPDELYGTVSGSGTLEITRWDRLRIEGRISFSAVELFVDSPREVDVSVEFSYACAAWHSGC